MVDTEQPTSHETLESKQYCEYFLCAYHFVVDILKWHAVDRPKKKKPSVIAMCCHTVVSICWMRVLASTHEDEISFKLLTMIDSDKVKVIWMGRMKWMKKYEEKWNEHGNISRLMYGNIWTGNRASQNGTKFTFTMALLQ